MMDPLVSGITQMQQAATMSRVQFAVARKLLNTQQKQGQAMVQLIEAASKTAVKAGDQLVAASTGLGGLLDVAA